jgi:SET and MYND domain-containing protein
MPIIQIRTNAFALLSNGDDVGGAFDLHVVSTINHSCAPNAAIIMDGPRVLVNALLPIPRGGEVFIAYVRTGTGRTARRNQLFRRYRFWCECEKCVAQAAEVGGDGDLPWHADMTVEHAECALQRFQDRLARERATRSALDPALSALSASRPSPEQAEARNARAFALGTVWTKYTLPASRLAATDDASPIREGLRFCAAEGLVGTQPYWLLKEQLALWHIDRGDFRASFLLDVQLYFGHLPVRSPLRTDPERARYAWRFYRLLEAFLADVEEAERAALPFDVWACLYGVAKDVADAVGRSHGDDTKFARDVHEVFAELKAAIASVRPVDWQALEEAVPGEFAKMRQYAEVNSQD